MNVRPDDTRAGQARTSVDLHTHMIDYHRTPVAGQYVHAFLNTLLARHDPDHDATAPPQVQGSRRAITAMPWQWGEPYVLAPAMAAIAVPLTANRTPHGRATPPRWLLARPSPCPRTARTARTARTTRHRRSDQS
jgi:hypothetical protein